MDRIQQVLINLLSNAFKFTQKGSITILITTSPTRNDYLLIKVADTGIGNEFY